MALEVHWFDQYTNGTDLYQAKCGPAYQQLRREKRGGPGYDVVQTDAVVVTFELLTKSCLLPM